jgi:ATP-dependent DNA helicase RecQ
MIMALSDLSINLIALDEAHLLSRWGPSFRKDYEELIRLRDIFPGVPIAALTATADKSTQEDIVRKLFGGHGKVFVSGFDRPNIYLSVAMRTGAKRQLLDVVKEHPGQSGIVYCLSRVKTEKMAAFLLENGYNALAYHAGMSADLRTQNQTAFMVETTGMIVVATIAFGMGIDKPDVRFVVHMDMPGNIESYYQEIGRAGRDSKPAVAHMFYGLDDLRMRRLFIEEDDGDPDHKRREHKRLDALISYCESSECRRWLLLGYFNEHQVTQRGCDNCDTCVAPPQVHDGTKAAKQILALILDTGQLFGQAHIIDILRGANTEKIRKFKHDQLHLYGIGCALDKNTWRTILRQMVAGRYLNLDVAGYGGLSLFPKGQEIMDGSRTFSYRSDVIKSIDKRKDNSFGRLASENLNIEQSELLAGLKAKRKELAQKRRVPPYMIFSDRSLEDMAHHQPIDEATFVAIHGVGAAKLKDFSADFIGVINNFISK